MIILYAKTHDMQKYRPYSLQGRLFVNNLLFASTWESCILETLRHKLLPKLRANNNGMRFKLIIVK